jgi:hypothetical protein
VDWVRPGCNTGAEYDGLLDLLVIGKPTPLLDRLKKDIENGKEVKIFTARASWPGQKELISSWLAETGVVAELEITDRKDFRMSLCYDDRSRQVIPNTGEVVGESITPD